MVPEPDPFRGCVGGPILRGSQHDRPPPPRPRTPPAIRGTGPRTSYAVEARLIGFDGIPPLHESLDQLRTCDESFLGVRDGSSLVGAVAWTRLPNGVLDLCRLVVHPDAHRRGVATALLDALDSIEPAELTVVSTATANLPALALYRRRGFTPVGERHVAPGVTVTLLERKRAGHAPVERGAKVGSLPTRAQHRARRGGVGQ